MIKVAIIGAGPAGVAAAEVLATHGTACTVIDEGREAGGQIYRRARAGLALDVDALLGAEADNYRRFHATFDALARPHRLPAADARLGGRRQAAFMPSAPAAPTCSIATLSFWRPARPTAPCRSPAGRLPGVFTLGAAQVLLKEHGCLIGRRIVFCGSSPLLYLAAKQCRAMGAEIVAVLDTTPFARKAAAARDLLAAPRVLARGLSYMLSLRRPGVPIHHGVTLTAFEGADGVDGVRFRDRNGRAHAVECDAVAVGFGLKPETQLAELAGAHARL